MTRIEKRLLILWFALAFVVWNGVYDMRMHDTVRGYLLETAGPHVVRDVERLAREIADQRLHLAANCAARTVIADIMPIVEISQRVGLPIEVGTFIGSSPLRQYAEGWTLDQLLRLTEDAVAFAVGEGLPVLYVTEDTTRADPDTLRALYSTAIRAGATRVCIADTV